MSQNYWLALLLVALGTQVFRFIFMGQRLTPSLPGPIKRAMDHVPAAVLAALVVPELVSLDNPNFPAIFAALTAIAAALISRRDFLAIVFGLLVYWILS
ncbi:MAG: AzlD domain-containing protein [Deltaproteobacteria bacterium]|jgi:branched-subunit amino acid transport protein|nr:AzlD domain-containing protein [Deltaproteobacteria bacterium]